MQRSQTFSPYLRFCIELTSHKNLQVNKINLDMKERKQTSSYLCCCCSAADSLPLHGLLHARLPCPSLSLGVCSNSCPLSWWCFLTISSSAAPFSCPQSFSASWSLPMSEVKWSEVTQSCPTLCDPVDCSPPGSYLWSSPGKNTGVNLNHILKSRDIILLTKVHVVKAMVFPVVICWCESWSIKKAEHWTIDTF